MAHLPVFFRSAPEEASRQHAKLARAGTGNDGEICPSLPLINPEVTQQTVPKKAAQSASDKGTIMVQPGLSQDMFCGFQHQVP